ncbi:MAG: hypothetical protein RL094_512 [Candidatus Parcubacteria bacterium]|jgi:1-acyl-sn-glycerol-3-phosphate acyltransferase
MTPVSPLQPQQEPKKVLATDAALQSSAYIPRDHAPSQIAEFFAHIYNTAARYSLYLSQFIAWVLCSILFRAMYTLDIKGKEKIASLTAPLIIVSNHINFYDGFIIRVALGAFPQKIMPLRFMAVLRFSKGFLNVLTWTGIIPLVYFLLGVFVIRQGQGIDKNLEKAQEVIGLHHTVVMYPEGKMIYDDTIGQFKKGAAALALKTGAQILPLSIRRIKETGKRVRMRINIGDALTLSPDTTYETGTELLYNVVGSLHAQK